MHDEPLRCSFCNKSQRDVQKLIAGPSVFICNKCIAICLDIIAEDRVVEGPGGSGRQPGKRSEMAVRPNFKKLRFTTRQKHCFYLCPFSEPFNSIYQVHVTPTVISEGFSIIRADQLYGTEPVIEDIWTGINEAELLIADVTGRNPNVAYEIGIAHTVGKPVILLTQNMQDVPFDLRHLRAISYESSTEGCEQLRVQLAATLRAFRDVGAAG